MLFGLDFKFFEEEQFLFQDSFVSDKIFTEGLSFFEFVLVDGDIFFEESNFFLKEDTLLMGFGGFRLELVELGVEESILVDFGLELDVYFGEVVMGLRLSGFRRGFDE